MPEVESPKKLYRSKTDRMVGGVCGGIAAYFNIDSSLVRLGWILLSLAAGTGLLVYVICWIVIPEES
jgi:phage shock protein C